MAAIASTQVKYIRVAGWVARIELHARVGTPNIGSTIDAGRQGRWRVRQVLREGGLLMGALLEAERA